MFVLHGIAAPGSQLLGLRLDSIGCVPTFYRHPEDRTNTQTDKVPHGRLQLLQTHEIPEAVHDISVYCMTLEQVRFIVNAITQSVVRGQIAVVTTAAGVLLLYFNQQCQILSSSGRLQRIYTYIIYVPSGNPDSSW